MRLFEKILGGNILYYPGCLTKFVAKDLKEKYEKILQNLGIDFIELSELELCCGSPALKAGYFEDFKNIAEKNLKIFKEHAVKKIITNCPACFMILKKYYKEVLGNKWDIKVEHTTQTINSKLKSQKSKLFENWKLEIENSDRKVVSYHDPCHLGRQMGVYEEPREVIKKLGYEILEMELNRLESFCCGGGGGVKSNEPELANKIAKDRISQAKKTGAKVLVTACPLCYLHLKENAKEINVKELSELFD
ncbi:MAG: (Fe-S)-binding protein [Patescibacteria group bacterium]